MFVIIIPKITLTIEVLKKIIMTKKTLFSIFYLITLFSYSQTAEDFFKSGTKKLFSEDYKGAIIDFTKTIEINHKSTKKSIT